VARVTGRVRYAEDSRAHGMLFIAVFVLFFLVVGAGIYQYRQYQGAKQVDRDAELELNR